MLHLKSETSGPAFVYVKLRLQSYFTGGELGDVNTAMAGSRRRLAPRGPSGLFTSTDPLAEAQRDYSDVARGKMAQKTLEEPCGIRELVGAFSPEGLYSVTPTETDSKIKSTPSGEHLLLI